MLELERQILNRNPLWREVLQQYIAVHEHARKHDPEHDGWTGRQTELAELPPEEQAAIHGRLIALGLIRIQIADRTAGLKYQVTGLGRNVLQAALNPADDSTTTDSTATDEAVATVQADGTVEQGGVETAETTADSAAAPAASAGVPVEGEPEDDDSGQVATPGLAICAESVSLAESSEPAGPAGTATEQADPAEIVADAGTETPAEAPPADDARPAVA